MDKVNTIGKDDEGATDVCCISTMDHVGSKRSVNVVTVTWVNAQVFSTVSSLTNAPYSNNPRVPELWTTSTAAYPSFAYDK